MIELPAGAGSGTASLIDFGFFQRGALGAETTRINRKGNRYKIQLTYGPFYAAKGSEFVSDLIAAKTEGLRVPYPLQQDQGSAGSPVVDGAGQAGTTLAIRGCTPGYVCRKGYWLSIVDANGRHYLHNVKTGGMADSTGDLSITIRPELRHAFADGATVNLTAPMVEGFVDGDEWAWNLSVSLTIPITFTLEEAA